ncbi:MAG: hypothetical protein WB992_06060 [Bryobacteraceae bacterium]
MALDLEALRAEMQAYLDESGLAVFHGYHGMLDSLDQVFWDTDGHPNFRDFLSAAYKAGARLIVFHHRSFSLDQIDEALDQLEDSDFTREEKRSLENRLRQLQAYEGFTCSLELSFTMESCVYVYELHTDWYQSLNDILAELEAAVDMAEGEEDQSLGGYFSKN